MASPSSASLAAWRTALCCCHPHCAFWRHPCCRAPQPFAHCQPASGWETSAAQRRDNPAGPPSSHCGMPLLQTQKAEGALWPFRCHRECSPAAVREHARQGADPCRAASAEAAIQRGCHHCCVAARHARGEGVARKVAAEVGTAAGAADTAGDAPATAPAAGIVQEGTATGCWRQGACGLRRVARWRLRSPPSALGLAAQGPWRASDQRCCGSQADGLCPCHPHSAS
mmetsp:Transcript_9842/g.29605  ORF Transcript_9842/g.29605 Transcript_9842/m.29605 type:complete len:227 (+) Transcript_9842:999-1679(+)